MVQGCEVVHPIASAVRSEEGRKATETDRQRDKKNDRQQQIEIDGRQIMIVDR